MPSPNPLSHPPRPALTSKAALRGLLRLAPLPPGLWFSWRREAEELRGQQERAAWALTPRSRPASQRLGQRLHFPVIVASDGVTRLQTLAFQGLQQQGSLPLTGPEGLWGVGVAASSSCSSLMRHVSMFGVFPASRPCTGWIEMGWWTVSVEEEGGGGPGVLTARRDETLEARFVRHVLPTTYRVTSASLPPSSLFG